MLFSVAFATRVEKKTRLKLSIIKSTNSLKSKRPKKTSQTVTDLPILIVGDQVTCHYSS